MPDSTQSVKCDQSMHANERYMYSFGLVYYELVARPRVGEVTITGDYIHVHVRTVGLLYLY